MKRDEAGCTMQPCLTDTFNRRALLVVLAWLTCTAEAIIVPTGKVGPITPYRSTPRPTPDPSRTPREPAPVVEYSQDHPEPPPLDPSYVPQSFKTLSALSGNSIFYIPLKIRNIHAFPGNTFSYVTQNQKPSVTQQPPQSQPKFVTWTATYNTPSDQSHPHPEVRIPIPIQEVDYLFPKKQRYQMKPIVVAPLPPIQQDYYHYNNKYSQRPQQFNNYNNVKDVYNDPSEDKSADSNRYRYDSNNGQYPKKYNQNNNGGATKYFYYVKHDYRTDNTDNKNNQ